MVPTSTDVTVSISKSISAAADAVAVFVPEKGGIGETPTLSEGERRVAERLISSGLARGKSHEVVVDLADGPGKKGRRVMVVGLGPVEKINADILRQAGGSLLKAARRHRVKNMAVVQPGVEAIDAEHTIEAIVNGVLLASFHYEEYKGTASKKKRDEDSAGAIAVTIIADGAASRAAVDRARILGDAQNFARTIASRPGNNINPPSLAKVAQQMAKEVGLAYRVLDEKEMAKLGMGGMLAVGGGSPAVPPRMIVLEHKGGKKGKPLLVVGKAITFDTGGISIKSADKMGKMIFDKCGGMAVLGLMYAVAKLKLPVHVVGILASAENHISDSAYRPGDILKMYNGVTVEVTNTDAEGRLVLGDALAWGIETYKPSAVVDLATLTGGVIVALGKTMAGVMSNNGELVSQLQVAADTAGEKFWRLPLGEDQRDYIKSEPADIVNSGGREGHPLQGGAFLSFFIPSDNSVPWAHLDIAGVADTEKDMPYYVKGATGWGVRTLVEWVGGRK